jgi:organic radical activating enzyme
MRKQILASCSLLVLLAVSGMPVRAQNSNSAPNSAPAATQTKISPEELQKFASTIKKLLVINQNMESQMSQAVQKVGLSEQRFGEIHRSKKDPSVKPTNQITPKEEQSYNQAVTQLSQIQKDAQTQMDRTVDSGGLGTERFNQILAQVQKSPQLRQELRKLLQSSQ